MMLSQYTADMQIVEQKMWSAPAFIQSIPAAADQEDFVSMGFNTVLKNADILHNARAVIGIEMMIAAQALDLRRKAQSCRFGDGVEVALAVVRKHVTFLDQDRPLYKDHDAMHRLLQDTEVLTAVEAAVGSLGEWDSFAFTPKPTLADDFNHNTSTPIGQSPRGGYDFEEKPSEHEVQWQATKKGAAVH